MAVTVVKLVLFLLLLIAISHHSFSTLALAYETTDPLDNVLDHVRQTLADCTDDDGTVTEATMTCVAAFRTALSGEGIDMDFIVQAGQNMVECTKNTRAVLEKCGTTSPDAVNYLMVLDALNTVVKDNGVVLREMFAPIPECKYPESGRGGGDDEPESLHTCMLPFEPGFRHPGGIFLALKDFCRMGDRALQCFAKMDKQTKSATKKRRRGGRGRGRCVSHEKQLNDRYRTALKRVQDGSGYPDQMATCLVSF